jgi:hypothetical protein
MGLFLGWRKQADHEALFFLGLNRWLMDQCGASWDRPTPIRDLLQHTSVRGLVIDYLRYSLRSPRVVSFLGLGGYLRHGSPERLELPWGWKDPRTTFTLPLWLELFPRAKIIHVCRHGVDVANSLRRRLERTLELRRRRYSRIKPVYLFHSKRIGFAVGLRCCSLDEGFALWEEYMQQARSHVAERGEGALEIRYEDFLADPGAGTRLLASFCGLRVQGRDGPIEGFQPERAGAYRVSPELSAFALARRDQLRLYGYGADTHGAS